MPGHQKRGPRASLTFAINANAGRGGRKLGPISINVRITAVRKLAVEAADNGLLAPELATGITRIQGREIEGGPAGELAYHPAGPDSLEYSGHQHQEGIARPRHPRRFAGVRFAAL